MKNIKHCVTFSPPQWAYLRAEADRLGIAIGEVVRRTIGEARPGFNEPQNKIISRLPRRF